MPFKNLIVESITWRGLYFLTVLLLNVLVARYFEATGSGWIYYLSNWYAFFILMISISMESGMGYFASKNEIHIRRLAAFSITWTVITGIVVTGGCFIYIELAHTLLVPKTLLFVSSLGYICGNLLTNYTAGIFYAKKNFKLPNLICIGCNLLLIILLLFTFTGFFDKLNATAYLYAYFISFCVQGMVLVVALVYSSPGREQLRLPSPGELRKLFRYSLTALAGNLAFFLVYRVDYWFVKTFCSASELGNYIQVSKLSQMIILLPSILASAVFPLVSGGHIEEVNRGLEQLSRFILIFVGGLSAFLILTGYWIFPLVFGATFSSMYMPFVLLVPGLLCISALSPLAAYFGGKNMLRVNLTGSLLGLVFILFADAIYVPLHGINAAAIISSLGYAICYGYVLVVFKRQYKTSLSGFFKVGLSDFVWMKKFLSGLLAK